MAVSPVSSIYKSLTFGGNDSRDYGVYITGSGVFNSPERDGEMLVIPGRNGAFWQDNGRFQNIEVTYPAGCFGDTEEDFAEAISNFRNMLCAQDGYVRLTDDYHPDEYRMAVYKSGLEVAPSKLVAGEFDIVFDCKPQRFLTSGETETSVSSGSTITNPTLFESSPIIKTRGYGDININDNIISIEDTEIGRLTLHNAAAWTETGGWLTLNPTELSYMNTGDDIIVNSGTVVVFGIIRSGSSTNTVTALSVTALAGDFDVDITSMSAPSDKRYRTVKVTIRDSVVFANGTSERKTATFNVTATLKRGRTTTSYTGTCQLELWYEESDGAVVVSRETLSPNLPTGFENYEPSAEAKTAQVDGISTKRTFDGDIYIDTDIGEAYAVDGEVITTLNNIVSLPPKLPKLKAGANTITYDNTITSVKVTPRWWRV